MQTEETRDPGTRLAVIGSGVAGLVAAHSARAYARVTLYEGDDRLGGHADTYEVHERDRTLHIDTGFVVHNRGASPVLTRILDELGIATQASEMSMSIADPRRGVEWAGARGLGGLFPTTERLADPGHLRMLAEIPRFHRRARALLAAPSKRAVGGAVGGDSDQTLGEFLARGRFSERFVRDYVEPLVAAVWSCDPTVATACPARYLFSFLAYHGMLSISGSPGWRTVAGGSQAYVRRIAAGLDEVHVGDPVLEVREHAHGVRVRTASGSVAEYDRVVIATHPHQALAMLPDATPAQHTVLGAIGYSPRTAILHTDTSLLPDSRRAWSSWNSRRVREDAGPVVVTYDLTRLQQLETDVRYLVTLGGEELVDPDLVIARREYEHPLHTPGSIAAQLRLPEIGTERVAFAGAYHGWGFHEDGARSGVEAVRRLGLAPTETGGRPAGHAAGPQIYRTTVRHLRRTPWRRELEHRSSLWVADLDALPATRGWSAFWHGSIQARDHLGDPGLSVRENLARFLDRHGVELGGGRVLLAAHPRALGLCFNPFSVYWCHRPDGSLLATVLEVHNTDGHRHAYLLDAEHSAPLEKRMYVSPFRGVDGRYDVHAPEPQERLEVAVRLRTPDGAAFSASVRGERIAAAGTGARATSRAAARDGLRDALLIRLHGLRRRRRDLPLRPRPARHPAGAR